MELALRSRTWSLRAVAPETFLNDLMPRQEWSLEVDEGLNMVAVNGAPSDEVLYNKTLRTLVWTKTSAMGVEIMSGALYDQNLSS